MNLLVSDTSVLIDLERAGLLEEAFQTGLVLVVPDLLYVRELENYNGAYLRGLGLGVLELTAAEVEISQQVKSERPALSLADCFALACSLRPDHVLLSGDGILRREAISRGSEVHGILWLLDEMKKKRVEVHKLLQGLTALAAHPRCRLPKLEIDRRLVEWSH